MILFVCLVRAFKFYFCFKTVVCNSEDLDPERYRLSQASYCLMMQNRFLSCYCEFLENPTVAEWKQFAYTNKINLMCVWGGNAVELNLKTK